jgi:hypothetical protein
MEMARAHKTIPREKYMKKRARCEPQDKDNKKGNRKPEKHGALFEAKHRERKIRHKSKINIPERKRHRETNTLRADAGKK